MQFGFCCACFLCCVSLRYGSVVMLMRYHPEKVGGSKSMPVTTCPLSKKQHPKMVYINRCQPCCLNPCSHPSHAPSSSCIQTGATTGPGKQLVLDFLRFPWLERESTVNAVPFQFLGCLADHDNEDCQGSRLVDSSLFDGQSREERLAPASFRQLDDCRHMGACGSTYICIMLEPSVTVKCLGQSSRH